jgi:serine protease
MTPPARLGAAAALTLATAALLWLPTAAGAETPDPADMPAGPALERLGPGQVALADEVVVSYRGDPGPETVTVPADSGVRATLAELREDPGVRWADPNPLASASSIPNDPGRSGKRGGWRLDQWNFLAPPAADKPCTARQPCGVNAPRAWQLLQRAGHRWGRRANGKRGPIVAVVDTGIAYRSLGKFRRDPDLAPGVFVAGKNFTHGGGPPLDDNGHGTHVASTIAEKTDNGRFVTGLGQGLRLMPIRVLDSHGDGSAADVARGIRWATGHGAKVINLSLEFSPGYDTCKNLRIVCRAIERAQRRGVFVVGAAGNAGLAHAQMPARMGFAVASGTIRGCLSEFSSYGTDIAITAPGGGVDATNAGSQCAPHEAGPGITQLTLAKGQQQLFHDFGYPFYEGTSMAAPHVSAAAALVLSSGVLRERLGREPKPKQLGEWLACTARAPFDPTTASAYGAGLLDLAAALDADSCAGLWQP